MRHFSFADHGNHGAVSTRTRVKKVTGANALGIIKCWWEMDKVYQVFVSSTFSDLKDERQQVSNTLAKAGYIAAGMELFPATDQQQLDYIKRIIDRSDYYVVILGGRYGSLAEDNVSFTEKEFEYAKSMGIPVLAFLHADPRKLAVEKTDEDRTKSELLNKFRAKLQSGRIIEFWSESSDLCMKVVIAVANAANLTPGTGWVRGGSGHRSQNSTGGRAVTDRKRGTPAEIGRCQFT